MCQTLSGKVTISQQEDNYRCKLYSQLRCLLTNFDNFSTLCLFFLSCFCYFEHVSCRRGFPSECFHSRNFSETESAAEVSAAACPSNCSHSVSADFTPPAAPLLLFMFSLLSSSEWASPVQNVTNQTTVRVRQDD